MATIWLVVDARVRKFFWGGSLCDVIESKSNQNTNESMTLVSSKYFKMESHNLCGFLFGWHLSPNNFMYLLRNMKFHGKNSYQAVWLDCKVFVSDSKKIRPFVTMEVYHVLFSHFQPKKAIYFATFHQKLLLPCIASFKFLYALLTHKNPHTE